MMRLLHTKTGRFVHVKDPRTVHYAVLSHVWSKEDSPKYVPEQSYKEVCDILAKLEATSPSAGTEPILPHLSEKLRRFCEVALADGFEFAWADTCCIDHANPSELEEAITSMYDWYSYAKACYVFLQYVSDRGRDAGSEELWETEFRQSEWFLRAWTLQELLAPNVVIFLSKNWQVLGSKHGLAPLLKDITSIERAVIRREKPLNAVSVARRMAWAASRKATREEDRAYSLLGIFGVSMRVVYGEGSYAFYRLQEAIINEIPDQTIFAWQLRQLPQTLDGKFSGHRVSTEREHTAAPSTTTATGDKQLPNLPVNALYHPRTYLLADSPEDFRDSKDLKPLSREEFAKILGVAPAHGIPTFRSTAYGMSARLPLVKFTPSQSSPYDSAMYLALLACTFLDARTLVALLLRPHANAPTVQASEYIVGTMLGPHSEAPPTPSDLRSSPSSMDSSYVRATVLTPEQLAQCRNTFSHIDIFIAHRPSRAQHQLERDIPLYRDLATTASEAIQVQLCGWSSGLLRQQGYTFMSPWDCPNDVPTLPSGILLKNVAKYFVIARDGSAHAPRLKVHVQVGHLCTNDVQALGVVVRLSDCDFKIEDGYSGLTGTHVHSHTHISSWSRQGGASSKELDLVPKHGTALTLRLVFTHSPSNPTANRGAAGSTPVYRLGAEIFDTQSQTDTPPGPTPPTDPASHSQTNPRLSAIWPNGPDRHLPSVALRSSLATTPHREVPRSSSGRTSGQPGQSR